MWNRSFWIELIQSSLKKRPIVWLSGVRRAGKTTLARSLPKAKYFDCELPRVRNRFADPEAFLSENAGDLLVLDEIHRLDQPTEILKIAADHFPGTRILATGSSVLGASSRFKDTLTGRKLDVWLTPVTLSELPEFHVSDIQKRMLYGGLPPFLLSESYPEREFQEWADSYWAKDVLELFRLERRHSFQKFFELLLVQSGGIFQASSFAAPCEASHTTISNYLAVLEATHVAHVVRPYHRSASSEIVAAPKVYGFDTGFICFFRGWDKLRADDMGVLWEHLVLNEMQAHLQTRPCQYWRDKQGHEVDFVLAPRRGHPVAIECKWKGSQFDPKSVEHFRKLHPGEVNLVVCSDVDGAYSRKIGKLAYKFVSPQRLIQELR